MTSDTIEKGAVIPAEPPKWLQLWYLLRSNKVFMIGAVMISFMILIAFGADIIAPWDPSEIDLERKLLPPGSEHFFGTDDLGRDVFSRVLHGADTSLMMGVLVVFTAVGIGVPVGLVAGYFGGRIDAVLMRFSEVFLAFPPLLLPIAITAALGPGLVNAILALAISWFPWYARIARASTLAVRQELFVQAGRVVGAGHLRLMFKHVLPNSLTPIIVQGSMDFGFAILGAAGLSFIGMGVRPPDIEWGLMVSSSQDIILEYWWTGMFPGLAILITVVAVNLLGDGIRDALDPNYSSERM